MVEPGEDADSARAMNAKTVISSNPLAISKW